MRLLPENWNKLAQQLAQRCQRKKEKPYTHCRWIGESYNTLTNLPFIVCGLYRLYGSSGHPLNPTLTLLYYLAILAGICSAIHHACAHIPNNRWSIYVDWLPIASSIFVLEYNYGLMALLGMLSFSTVILVCISFALLLSDHLYTPLPVPIGHCLWHICAACAMDGVYQNAALAIAFAKI